METRSIYADGSNHTIRKIEGLREEIIDYKEAIFNE